MSEAPSRTAIFIHGTPSKEEYFDPQAPSPSNAHWFPWLQKQLLINGYETQTPEMPVAYQPNYSLWKKEFEKHPLTKDSLLAGHSCGGGFLVRWLSENKVPVARVVLIAPWIDPANSRCIPGFFDFKIDPAIALRTDLHIIYSDNDSAGVSHSCQRIIEEISAIKVHLMRGLKHFCTKHLGTNEFPALRDILLGVSPTAETTPYMTHRKN